MKVVKLKSIKRIGIMPTKCISLGGSEGLYVSDNNIITHNSLLSVLTLGYIAATFGNMIAPWKVLGHSPATQYGIAMGCNTLGRASQLILEPFESLMESAPFFEKVKRKDEFEDVCREDANYTKLFYTGATRSSDFNLRNNLKIKRMNDPFGLIGLTLVAGTLTEIGWFKDAGWEDARIFKFFTDLQERIGNRMQGHYLGRFIIDSSPNSLESPIDEWVVRDAPKNPENYIITGSRWKHYPQEFPDFFYKDPFSGLLLPKRDYQTGFQMFLGNEKEPPRVVENAIQASKYDTVDLVWCPKKQSTAKGTKDFLMLANTSPSTFLRNYAGIPTGTADRIFANPEVIENVFKNDLVNIYNSITADPMAPPESLIWNQVKDVLFTEINGKYYFYRESSLPRAVAVDQSYAKDATGIAIMHTEYTKRINETTGEVEILTMYVVDATIVVIPKDMGISLDALRAFVVDLKEKGNLDVRYASFDSFQSVPTQQALKRVGIGVEYNTVDKDKGNEAYKRMIEMVIHGRLKAGKNLHLKNNLKSIQLTKRKGSGTPKYDHTQGDIIHVSDDMSWETSKIGIHAKDALDAVTGAMQVIANHEAEFEPMVEWRETLAEGIDSINDVLAAKGLRLV